MKVILGAFLGFGLATAVQAVEFSGTVQFADYAALGTVDAGVVSEVKVASGEQVKKGQVLVRLDTAAAYADLNAAKKSLQASQAEFAEAEREKERAEELFDRGSLSDHQLNVALAEHLRAEAGLARAEAEHLRAGQMLRHRMVKAPYAATVLDVIAVPGKSVVNSRGSETLVTLAASDRFLVRVAVRPSQFNSAKIGSQVSAVVGEARYQGTISAVAYEHGNQSPYAVYVTVPVDEGASIPLGQSASVDLP